ncbi:MAG: hypothetical protein KJO40_13700 [Deltaproteobacteria bacterium]|nr:hypothetical protein [Deltaproteobacteria bacterium]
MATAADIDEAIELVVVNVLSEQATMDVALSTWLVIFGPQLTPTGSAPFFPLDENKPAERTVRDWQVPTRRTLGEVPAGGVAPDWLAEEVITVVNRTLQATKFARLDGRITQDQEDGVVYQYNQAWD